MAIIDAYRGRIEIIRKTFAVFVLASLLSVMAGTGFVGVVEANYMWPFEVVPPEEYAKAPIITIISPENNTVISTDSIVLSFNVEVGESETDLDIIFVKYKTDWEHNMPDHFLPRHSTSSFSHEVTLTEIPEGTHNITVQAIERGTYKTREFELESSKTIFLTIDGIQETKIPEFPSWAILPLLLAATLAAAVYTKKLTRK
jgi:hypothetical protein